MNCAYHPLGIFLGYILRSYLSRDCACSSSFFEGKDTSEAELTDRWIGLNMNYSIIFTEISFYPETSILLQIIRIIHMTIWIIPESDREGRAVCQIWLQGGINNETPTEKRKLVRTRAPLGTLGPSPSFITYFLKIGGKKLKGKKGNRCIFYPSLCLNLTIQT